MTTSSRGIRRRRTWLVHGVYLTVIAGLTTAMLIPTHRDHTISLTVPQVVPFIPPYAERMVTLMPGRMTINAFAKELSTQTGVRMQATWVAISKRDYDPDSDYVLIQNGGRMTLEQALRLIANLGNGDVHTAYEQEQVVIGPEEAIYAPARCETVAYPVGDFLEVDDPERESINSETRMRELTDLIQHTVTPDKWRPMGGSIGDIQTVFGALVVNTTPDAQYKVAALLAALRAAK